jgi:YVTN family beta-propeller protein
MKISNLSRQINSLTNNKQRRIIATCFSGVLIMGVSACNEESVSEITDATITDETLMSAETLVKTNPTDMGQHQTLDHDHGPYGYRQQGYVNQDGYMHQNGKVVENRAYYGDWDNNVVQIIDIDNMKVLSTVSTGDGPYGIDQQGPDKAYALTRRTESMTVVDNNTLDYAGLLDLQHKPRSTNHNANTSLSLVSGGDKAMTSIIRIDNDEVTKVVGKDELTTPDDFGGSLSTGHPLWVTDHHFFMLDRAARQIQLWNRDGQMLSVLDTPTSIHHIFQPPLSTMDTSEKNVFYAVIEGNRDKQVSPGIIRFNIKHNSLNQTAQVNLHDYDPENLDISTMGSHHADFHPGGVYIYIGSAEGHVFVINKSTMKIEAMVDSESGSGHTTFLPTRDLAIITNHNSEYMTVIDTVNHQFVKNIKVASSASPEYKSQAHTSGVSLDEKYFYSTASHDGDFFRIDLDTWDISKLHIGGNLLMGSFVWNGDGVNM